MEEEPVVYNLGNPIAPQPSRVVPGVKLEVDAERALPSISCPCCLAHACPFLGGRLLSKQPAASATVTSSPAHPGARFAWSPLRPGLPFERPFPMEMACPLHAAACPHQPAALWSKRGGPGTARRVARLPHPGVLGLAVDLRWFEPAWGPGLAIFNKILLLDAGIYGFLAVRQLRQVGFDLRLRLRDFRVGLLWLAAYAPIGVALGLCARLPPFPPSPPFVPACSPRLDLYLFLCRRPGRAFLPWLDAESSRAASWSGARPAHHRNLVRAFALQQARSPLQLALCCAGIARGHFLRPCVASGSPGGSFSHHPRVGRYDLVGLVAMIAGRVPVFAHMVPVIANPHAHMVL